MPSSNTSKTAHVMNLLSKNRSGSAAEAPKPQTEAQAAAQPESAPAAAPAAPVAPIISSINADAAVSSQIKEALEAELEGAPTAAPVQPPVHQEAPAVQAPPAQESPVQPEAPVVQAPPVQESPVQPEAPAAAPPVQAAPSEAAPPVQESSLNEEPSYVNVMQILVEEKADEYMKLFGICCCDKCRVDVRAYALNHLPPKYVVMSEHERVPRLTVYESRFNSDITAQLIQACKQVMLTPHHSRADD